MKMNYLKEFQKKNTKLYKLIKKIILIGICLVGFCASFGAKYFGGYARDSKADNSGKWSAGAIRNLKKQLPNIKDVRFVNADFNSLPLDKIKNYVIYCDIPYHGTTKYATETFPYEQFYEWVKKASVHNTVLISEYSMPDDFTCIWSKETKTLLDSNKDKNDDKNIRIEKLFTYKIQIFTYYIQWLIIKITTIYR